MKPYTHFTLSEREYLQQLLSEGKSLRKIAEILGRSPSSISREVKRNFSKKKKGTMLGERPHYTLSEEDVVFENLQ